MMEANLTRQSYYLLFFLIPIIPLFSCGILVSVILGRVVSSKLWIVLLARLISFIFHSNSILINLFLLKVASNF